ncbi:MAG: hypothetical protein ACKVI4_17375, partial [Actinomycetales bacterium]
TTVVHCQTTLTYCATGDGQADTESRLVQCSLFDTTFRTIYVHSERVDALHSHDRPIFDSPAFPALRASDVVLDGSIDVPFDLVDYGDETFATVGGRFVYMYIGDTDDTTWNAVQFDQWNAVLHDGTPSTNGCLDGVPPLGPPTPSNPPTSPPVFYLETNATECPLGPLTLALCDAANVELHGIGDTHIDITEAPTSPRGCFVGTAGTYAYSSLDNPGVDCSDVVCVCLHPNTTFASPGQPPAPPLSPPPPSPPFRPPPAVPPPHSPPSTPLPPSAPPPVNLTIGGISVDNSTVPAWQFEVIVVENTKTRIYFESGFTYEENDFVIFVPMYAGCSPRTHYTHTHPQTPSVPTKQHWISRLSLLGTMRLSVSLTFFFLANRTFTSDNPGAECSIASSLSWTALDDDPTDLSTPDHGGPILVDEQGRLYVDVVLHNSGPASADPLHDLDAALEKSANYRTCLAKHPATTRRALTTITLPFVIGQNDWILVDIDQIHVVDHERPPPPPPAPPAAPPKAPSDSWLWLLPYDLCDDGASLQFSATQADALATCLAHNCSGLATKAQLADAFWPAVSPDQPTDRCPYFGWVADDAAMSWFYGDPNRTHLDDDCADRYADLDGWQGGYESEMINQEATGACCQGCPLDLHECSPPTGPPPSMPPPNLPPPCGPDSPIDPTGIFKDDSASHGDVA